MNDHTLPVDRVLEVLYNKEMSMVMPCKNEDGTWIWFTKEGLRIPLNEMHDSHLLNSISMVQRNSPSSPWLPILQTEWRRRLSDQVAGTSGEGLDDTDR